MDTTMAGLNQRGVATINILKFERNKITNSLESLTR